MASVNILNVKVLDNPAIFTNLLRFEITFECLCPLTDDLNWKLVYVGSAESAKYDQVLDSIMVGPVPVGINRFIFEAEAPRSELVPPQELRGVTVLLLICSYVEQEFIRIGYYVDNDYEDEILREEIQEVSSTETSTLRDKPIDVSKLRRNILEEKPRVTRFNIIWDDNKLAQSKLKGETIFEVPEELLAIKDPVNFENSENEDFNHNIEARIEEDVDSEEMDEAEEISEEDIAETEDEEIESEEDISELSTEEGLISEYEHPTNFNQVAVMDMIE